MPHLHRFIIPPDTPGNRPVTLSPEEAHHAARVVRVREDDNVALFDGAGREILGTVAVCDKKEVVVEPVSERSEPAPAPAITLALAWLHRDKPVEFAIRHATELGTAHFIFYRAERSERPPKNPDKWDKLAVEICKQCGRLWLPDFTLADSLAEVLDATPERLLAATADREATPWSHAVRGGAVTLVVGPEGDFTTGELAALDAAGALPVSLGSTIYRAEVAAVMGCAVIAYEAGNMGPRS